MLLITIIELLNGDTRRIAKVFPTPSPPFTVTVETTITEEERTVNIKHHITFRDPVPAKYTFTFTEQTSVKDLYAKVQNGESITIEISDSESE